MHHTARLVRPTLYLIDLSHRCKDGSSDCELWFPCWVNQVIDGGSTKKTGYNSCALDTPSLPSTAAAFLNPARSGRGPI